MCHFDLRAPILPLHTLENQFNLKHVAKFKVVTVAHKNWFEWQILENTKAYL